MVNRSIFYMILIDLRIYCAARPRIRKKIAKSEMLVNYIVNEGMKLVSYSLD